MAHDPAVRVALDVVPRLSRLVTKVLEGELQSPMTVSQFRILARLATGDDAVGALALGSGVRAPSMSQALDGLVARGWIAREQDPADRRRKRVHLTAAGRKALAAAEQALARELGRLLDDLTDEERRALVEGLGGLRRTLDRRWEQLARAARAGAGPVRTP